MAGLGYQPLLLRVEGGSIISNNAKAAFVYA